MNRIKRIYTDANRLSAVMLMVALLWLTVSTPFVYQAQQHYSKFQKAATSSSLAGNEEECNDSPQTNTTEEKAPGGMNSLSEEYLHHHDHSGHFLFAAAQYPTWHAATYTAFHGEMLVPPPNCA